MAFTCRWVPKDGENISEADKASSHEFKEFSELELGEVKVVKTIGVYFTPYSKHRNCTTQYSDYLRGTSGHGTEILAQFEYNGRPVRCKSWSNRILHMQDGGSALDDLGKRMMKLDQDFMKVHRDAASTGVGVGLGILTAGYFCGPKAAAAVGASCTCLYRFMYSGDLKL